MYLLIALGWVAGRFLDVDRDSLARVAIFICIPIVVFGFIAKMDFQPAYMLLPLIVYAAHMFVGITMWKVGQIVYPDNRANLLSMCCAVGNAGYMGLPIVLMLFDAQWVAIYMFMNLANPVYEATFNYYVSARSQFSAKKSLEKLIKFPVLYAVILGLAANFTGLPLPGWFDSYWDYFKGAYVVLGMMIIGIAFAASKKLEIAPRFLGLVFLGKFVLWPVLMLAIIAVDTAFTQIFNKDIYSLMLVLAIVPPAANTVAFAAQFNIRPEKAATTVLIGTIFALIYIPLVLVIFGVH